MKKKNIILHCYFSFFWPSADLWLKTVQTPEKMVQIAFLTISCYEGLDWIFWKGYCVHCRFNVENIELPTDLKKKKHIFFSKFYEIDGVREQQIIQTKTKCVAQYLNILLLSLTEPRATLTVDVLYSLRILRTSGLPTPYFRYVFWRKVYFPDSSSTIKYVFIVFLLYLGQNVNTFF